MTGGGWGQRVSDRGVPGRRDPDAPAFHFVASRHGRLPNAAPAGAREQTPGLDRPPGHPRHADGERLQDPGQPLDPHGPRPHPGGPSTR